MSEDRSTRTMVAVFLLIAALFVAINRVVDSAPAADWWLPVALGVIGIGLILSLRVDFSRTASDEAEEPALSTGDSHTYRVTATAAATASPAAPSRLHTMTIRPDPDTAQYTITAVQTESDVLPFMESPTPVVAEAVAAPPEPAPAIIETAVQPPPVPEPAPVVAEAVAAPPPEPAPAPPAPPKPAPAADKPDDLTKIVGIGPKSAAALKVAGIDTYAKLASASPDALRAALEGGHVRLVGDFDTWPQQAAYAARGDWAGLEKFVSERRSSSSD